MYVRFLSVISLLGLVMALSVTAFGYQDEISSYFGPSGSFESDVSSTVKAPIDKADSTNARAQVEHLMRAVPFETVGVTQLNEEQLQMDLLRAEPSSGLDKPLAQGGVDLTVVDGKFVVFCIKPNAQYECIAQDPLTRVRGDYATDNAQQATVQQAILSLQR